MLLLDLAGRRATGRLAFGDRTAVLSEGELVDISPPTDGEQPAPKRTLFIERLGAALRTSEARDEPVPVLEPALRSREPSSGVPFAPLVLDAVARTTSESDLAWLALQLNHRITLRELPVSSVARAWAGIDLAFSRPAVSTVLAKRPDAGPRLAALLRTGLAQLEAPGRTGPSQPPGSGTLPPPPPRLSAIPSVVAATEDKPDLLSQLSVRPPRLRLGPGQAHDAGEPLVATPLPPLRPQSIVIDDPIENLEQRIAALEAAGAKGPERARAFVALADTWLQRLGSIERACRALREACAADPSDARTLQQTALYCHILGEPELALRYAEGAIHAAGISVDRASAQRLRAAVLRTQNRRDEMIEALCEAAADDPASPEPHEMVASLLESSNPEGANAHARLAAAGFSDNEPKRALALLDWAFALLPADVPTVYEYASLLDAQGSRNAAVAVLARAAELQTDPDARRKLRLSAAQRAEAAGRADRAAELLEDALDAEPHFDLLYAPLDEDLASAGFAEHRAVVLEDIATACPEDQRALWLSRAAQALLAIEGQRESALWIAFEAALVDGLRAEPLDLLRAEAKEPLELVLLAYALRAAAAAGIARGRDSSAALRELAALGVERLDNPELALAALEQLERSGVANPQIASLRERATQRAAQREVELRDAEQALAAATDGRAALCLRVASLLPDLPEAWPRRIELLHQALAEGAPRASTVDALIALYGLTRDAAGLAAFLEDQIDSASTTGERAKLLLRLAAVHTVREDAHAVAATCELLLAIESGHRMAVARLLRAARRLGVPALWARALEHRARVAADGKQRGRALARLARAYELAGARSEAALRAIDALKLDPDSADAAIVLLATANECVPERALPALKLVPRALCGSARAYRALMTVAANANDRAEETAALKAWTEILPSDARAHELRLMRLPESESGAVMHEIAQAALSNAASEPVITAVRGVIDRLERAGHEGLAARLCLRLAEEQGRSDAGLLQRAASLAKRIAPELRTRALELWACAVPERERVGVWLELAAHHATQGEPLGELRALLRVLELDVAHPAALTRLHTLFLASGDVGRALSIATLRLETQDDPDARRAGLIELAALSGRLGKDLPRAELYVRRMVAESQGDLQQVRRALGVLVSLGDPAWAITRARTIADGCPEDLRGRIYHACATTAEQTLKDRALALELASLGARSSPNHAPLLLMMERLSLDASDKDTALRTYDALIDSAIGPHGRRALVYRAGRWLERAGDMDQALDRYLEAFDLEPNAGAAFIALGRVAQATGKVERTLNCYERLSGIVPHELTRVDMVRRAQDIALGPLDDPGRAVEILRRAIAVRDHVELTALAERAASELRKRDANAGRRAFAAIAEDIERRAEQLWEGPDKVRSLLRIATIMARELDQPAAALVRAEEAVNLVEREALGMELLAEALAERERIESIAGASLPPQKAPAPTDDIVAAPALFEAPAPVPSTPPKRTNGSPNAGAMVSAAPPPKVESLTPPPRAVSLAPKPASITPPKVESLVPPPKAESLAPPPKAEGLAPKPASVEPVPRVEGVAPPAPVSVRPPASAPPADRAGARDQLLDIIAREPYRADAIRKLHTLTSHEPKSLEAHVASALLAAFDAEVGAPAERPFHSGVWRGDALQTALADTLPVPARRMLARLWEASRTLPRFRMTPQSAGLTERDRLAQRTVGMVAETYAQAARLLGARDVPVFETSAEGPRDSARVVAAHPPFILVHAALATARPSRSGLLWTFGRALQLALPDQVFGSALAVQDARDLLHAAALAFAPRTAQGTVTPQIKELAASLWQNVPAGEQRSIANTLAAHKAELGLEALLARAEATAARAGLLCSGNIYESLKSVAHSDPKLAGLTVHDAATFAEACKRSVAYAATVQCAVSPELRAALALARGAR